MRAKGERTLTTVWRLAMTHTKGIAEQETEVQGTRELEMGHAKERNDKKLNMSKAGERW